MGQEINEVYTPLDFGQILFEPSRKLSSVMKLAENCLKVGLSGLLGCSFQLSGRLLAKT
jgi:hypothetical protein